ncbi:phage antirepressor N-terminal domain-containing protein [Prauserella flavalba]|uniref:phage antirepressor N-terminal domain-containing protein n=1 Tax=Prauserella flavalba TaxID=1477506 RepID=UPI0036DFB0E9
MKHRSKAYDGREGDSPDRDPSLVRIPFHGDELLVVDVDGKPHIVLKPAIEAIGLDYWSQVEKLRKRSWAVTSNRQVQVSDQAQRREMLTCNVRTFLMLLATVDENRVAKDVRTKLIAYQAESADAIEAYWTKGGAINPRATDDQLAAIIGRAKHQLEVLRLADGLVDPGWLESKARHVAARALGEEPEDDPAFRPLTVGEYLDERGVTTTAARKLSPKFGKLLKVKFIARHGEPPGTSRRFVDGAQRNVAVYTEQDRDLFDAVWHELTTANAA